MSPTRNTGCSCIFLIYFIRHIALLINDTIRNAGAAGGCSCLFLIYFIRHIALLINDPSSSNTILRNSTPTGKIVWGFLAIVFPLLVELLLELKRLHQLERQGLIDEETDDGLRKLN